MVLAGLLLLPPAVLATPAASITNPVPNSTLTDGFAVIEGVAAPGAGEVIGGAQVKIGRVRDDTGQWEEWCWVDHQWEPWNFHDPVNGDWLQHTVPASETAPGFATWRVDTSAVTSWVPGIYVIGAAVWATIDGAWSSGVWIEAAVGIGHDITPPTVTLTTPVNGATYPSGPEVAGTAADTGGSGVERVAVRVWLSKAADSRLYIWDFGMHQWVLWDGDDISPSRVGIASGSETWTLTDAPAWERGHGTVEVRAVDGNGNSSPPWAVAASFLVFDSAPPTVTTIEPAYAATYADGLSEVRGTASDGDGSGVASVQVLLYLNRASDNALLLWNWATREWEAYNWGPTTADQVALAEGTDTWRLAQLPEWKPGWMTVRAIATDRQGNAAECWQGCVIANTPPSVAITSPASGAVCPGGVSSIQGTSTDPTTPALVTHLVLYRWGGPEPTPMAWNWVTGAWDPAGGWSTDWEATSAEAAWSVATGAVDWVPGEYGISAWAYDCDGAGTGAWNPFTVPANQPPTITSVTATPSRLWPANHRMVDVHVTVAATDDTGVAPFCRIVTITSSEPDNGLGDGDTAGDIEITGPLTARLRAERSGTGKGRIYTIIVEAVDTAGGVTHATTRVTVPHHARG